MDSPIPMSPGDLWAIDLIRAHRFFACQSEPRQLSAVGMEARTASRETPSSSTAVISVVGPIAKDTWIEAWGGTSALSVQAQVQAARADDSVDSLFMLIDSPGGEVAGLEELVDEVFSAAAVMPIHAHIDDLGASAAYWIASQATTVSANSSALVGSIGAIAQVADISKMLEEAGIQMHTIRSGDKKAALAGPAITDDALDELQAMIDSTASRFLDDVQRGRGITGKVRENVADARVMPATEGRALGLLDSIQSRQAAFDSFRGALDGRSRTRQRAAASLVRAGEIEQRERYNPNRYR